MYLPSCPGDMANCNTQESPRASGRRTESKELVNLRWVRVVDLADQITICGVGGINQRKASNAERTPLNR